MQYVIYFVVAVAIAVAIFLMAMPYLTYYYREMSAPFAPMPYLNFKPDANGIAVYAYDATNRSVSAIYLFDNGILKGQSGGYGYLGDVQCGDKIDVLYVYSDGKRWLLSGVVRCTQPFKTPSQTTVESYMNLAEKASYLGQVAIGKDTVNIKAKIVQCNSWFDQYFHVYEVSGKVEIDTGSYTIPAVYTWYPNMQYGGPGVIYLTFDTTWNYNEPIKMTLLSPPSLGTIDDFVGGRNMTIVYQTRVNWNWVYPYWALSVSVYINGTYIGTCEPNVNTYQFTYYLYSYQRAPANGALQYTYCGKDGGTYLADIAYWQTSSGYAIDAHHTKIDNTCDPRSNYISVDGIQTNLLAVASAAASDPLVALSNDPNLPQSVKNFVNWATSQIASNNTGVQDAIAYGYYGNGLSYDTSVGDIPYNATRLSFTGGSTVVRSMLVGANQWSASATTISLPGMFLGAIQGYTPYILTNYSIVILPVASSSQPSTQTGPSQTTNPFPSQLYITPYLLPIKVSYG
ncbi:MAG: hypothetical protein QXU93_08035 [Thermoproteus sp.]